MLESYAIHWFRRDLRIEGNAAFLKQVKKFDGRVLGLFIFDQKFLKRADFSHKRFDFFIETLRELEKSLKKWGSDLLVLDQGPELGFKELITKQLQFKPSCISFNRDYEPFARNRDQQIQKLCDEFKIEVEHFRDHLIIEPHELLKDDGTFYKVFTPFSKKWKNLLQDDEIQKRISLSDWTPAENKKICNFDWDNVLNIKQNISSKIILQNFQKECKKHHDIILPMAGHHHAIENIKKFMPKMEKYGIDRDIPSLEGTSKSSIYLKNGSMTTAQIVKKCKLSTPKLEINQEKFLNEIIWREFYYHLLYHQPTVEKETFQSKYANLAWEKNSGYWKAWCEGKTGFPIVDAGMRELNQTGWMHNRVRMIVASFLCKDLLINYQEGERYFMQHLLDGDLAPNNGGWQWAASTGCDAQPYFRIFNPWTQGAKFDPDAVYIKKYIPELKNDSAKTIHNPLAERNKNYPKPIVLHDVQRVLALKIYSQH
jgi:deoxyribodipyrimidine photo-lyase